MKILSLLLEVQLGHILAHVTTAQLSWLKQNYNLIGSSVFVEKQHDFFFSQDLVDKLINPLCNGSQIADMGTVYRISETRRWRNIDPRGRLWNKTLTEYWPQVKDYLKKISTITKYKLKSTTCISHLALFLTHWVSLIHGSRIKWKSFSCLQFRSYSDVWWRACPSPMY